MFVLLAGYCLCGLAAFAEQLPLLGLAGVNIRVSNLDQARAFYFGVGGFDDAFDVRNADGTVAAAYLKVNDLQFLKIIPGLKENDVRPMLGFAILTEKLEKLHGMLLARGLQPSQIRTGADGSLEFEVTNLPGQDLDYIEFVQYGSKSLAQRTKGQSLGDHRLSTHLEHVGVIATDFDAAYDFYVKTLGFHETWRRLTADRSRVIIDHIQMPGPNGDMVELSNKDGGRSTSLTRKAAGGEAHFALTVSDIQTVVPEVNARKSGLPQTTPHYGLDNRWNFNLFDPDGTRMEFMQVADPAHPAPAVVATPPDGEQSRGDLGMFQGQADV
jgi:catechol 2,3-dioxygenase-like lactoylglutathione lyase family enzyme